MILTFDKLKLLTEILTSSKESNAVTAIDNWVELKKFERKTNEIECPFNDRKIELGEELLSDANELAKQHQISLTKSAIRMLNNSTYGVLGNGKG